MEKRAKKPRVVACKKCKRRETGLLFCLEQNREVRKVHNERNVGSVYEHLGAFVENPKNVSEGKVSCNGLSFFLRTSSMSKSVKLVTVFINLHANGP